MKRRGLAIIGFAVLVATSGCMGLLTGDGLQFESEPAAVSNSSAAETGFVLDQYNATQINESINVSGLEREVRISFHQAIYTTEAPDTVDNASGIDETRQSELSGLNVSRKPATVTILSMPDAKVLGQSVNPLVRLPTAELIKQFADQGQGNADNIEEAGERSVELLGEQTTMTEFSGATAERNRSSESASLTLGVAKTAHEGDVVFVVAGVPEGGDWEQVDEFIAEIEHPTDPLGNSSAEATQ